MPNTYSQIYIHLVFAVKHRDRLLPATHKEEIHKYITGICKKNATKLIAINSVSNHIHILIGMNPVIALSDLVRDIKSSSTVFINEKGFVRGKFSWQEGYGAFSNGHSQLGGVVKYIENQEKHHARKSFKDEYLDMLKKWDVAYADKYLFDFDGIE